jgi:hypothetical protein
MVCGGARSWVGGRLGNEPSDSTQHTGDLRQTILVLVRHCENIDVKSMSAEMACRLFAIHQ